MISDDFFDGAESPDSPKYVFQYRISTRASFRMEPHPEYKSGILLKLVPNPGLNLTEKNLELEVRQLAAFANDLNQEKYRSLKRPEWDWTEMDRTVLLSPQDTQDPEKIEKNRSKAMEVIQRAAETRGWPMEQVKLEGKWVPSKRPSKIRDTLVTYVLGLPELAGFAEARQDEIAAGMRASTHITTPSRSLRP